MLNALSLREIGENVTFLSQTRPVAVVNVIRVIVIVIRMRRRGIVWGLWWGGMLMGFGIGNVVYDESVRMWCSCGGMVWVDGGWGRKGRLEWVREVLDITKEVKLIMTMGASPRTTKNNTPTHRIDRFSPGKID